jgi:hypothetical protein
MSQYKLIRTADHKRLITAIQIHIGTATKVLGNNVIQQAIDADVALVSQGAIVYKVESENTALVGYAITRNENILKVAVRPGYDQLVIEDVVAEQIKDVI